MGKLNKVVAMALIGYPLCLVVASTRYGVTYGIGWAEALLFLSGFYVTTIVVGIGLHRLWAHNSYKAHPWVERALMWLAAGVLQGPVLAWASDHAYHHTFTDKDQDPHSPQRYTNKLKGFFWAHMGWMLFSPPVKKIDRGTLVRLGKKPYLLWQMKHYWKLAIFMSSLPPAVLGWLMIGGWQGAAAGVVFIGLGRALQQHMTFAVNSVCHFIGRRRYVDGTARDIAFLFFALLGENWHNFHHAFPCDYRNGHKWYHLDIHKWIIALMEKLGLARDLNRTTEERIQAKVTQTKETLSLFYSWEEIRQNAERIAEQAIIRLTELDSCSKELAAQAAERLRSLHLYAEKLAEEARVFAAHSQKTRKRLLIKATANLRAMEIQARYLELPVMLSKPALVRKAL